MARLALRFAVVTCVALLFSAHTSAATFVYISNAEDGDISTYQLKGDGELLPGPKAPAAKIVMPMTVSADRKVLHAAARSKPWTLYSYSIDPRTGALAPLATAPLPGSMVSVALDRTGRWLLSDSYGESLVSVSPVGLDGKASNASQVLPLARYPHTIKTDRTNRFAYVPHLWSDTILQFNFDEKTGRLTSMTPPLVQLTTGTGPRHFVISADNRFMYLLSELVGTVTTLAIDKDTGHLKELASIAALPADTTLVPGRPAQPASDPNRPQTIGTTPVIKAAEIQMTPDGKFLYVSERTSSVLCGFRVDGATGTLSALGCTPTEKQPRGFAIDPTGRWLVAAGEKSPTVSVYAIDPATGALQPKGKAPSGKGANWVEIITLD